MRKLLLISFSLYCLTTSGFLLAQSTTSGTEHMKMELDPMIANWLKTIEFKEITIPEMSKDCKETGYFTIERDAKTIRYKSEPRELPGTSDKVSSKKWLCNNFKLEVGGLPSERVAKIDSFTWNTEAIGQPRQSGQEDLAQHTSVEISELKLTISMLDIDDWQNWHEESSNIQDKQKNEKSGKLTFLNPGLDDTLMTISFGQIGIISLEQEAIELNNDNVERFTVELYAEQIKLE